MNLSIKITDYKKKYNDALERARDLMSNQNYSDLDKHLIETIFPELKDVKEDENTRIKKVLIDYFQKYKEQEDCGIKTFYGIPTDDILAWLEKRGEQKPNYCHHEVDLSGCSEEYKKAYYDGWNNCNMQHSQCKSELDDVLKCLINGMKFYYEDNKDATWGTYKWSMPVKHIIEVLEKQGEQKPVDKVEPRFKVKYAGSEYNVLEVKDIAGVTFYGIEDEPNHIDYVKAENCEIISGYAIKENGSPYPTKPAVFSEKKPTAWLEKQNVKKDIDMSDLKPGAWIVHNTLGTCKIVCLNVTIFGSGYEVVSCNDGIKHFIGFDEESDSYSLSNCHLWTINDANDGDVLVDSYSKDSIIILYKGIDKERSILAHCGWNGYSFSIKTNGLGYGGLDNTDYLPATKEQRDLLFEKMKNTGYEWDAENKELKQY